MCTKVSAPSAGGEHSSHKVASGLAQPCHLGDQQ